jgi:hypothetical protein
MVDLREVGWGGCMGWIHVAQVHCCVRIQLNAHQFATRSPSHCCTVFLCVYSLGCNIACLVYFLSSLAPCSYVANVYVHVPIQWRHQVPHYALHFSATLLLPPSEKLNNNNNNNNNLANMQLGHLLTCFVSHLEVSLMVCLGFFCLLVCSFFLYSL